MRTMMTTLAALAAAAVLVACGGGSGDSGEPLGTVHTVVVRSDASVPVDQTGLSLRLSTVSDTRCPLDAICVQAGHASITMALQRAGSTPQTVAIGLRDGAGPGQPGDAAVDGWRFSLQTLEPFPRAGVAVPLAQYRATVRVERSL